MGDLKSGSVVSNFQALDYTLWPELEETRESKEVFALHGRGMVSALHDHYSAIMERHEVSKEDVLNEYCLYKTWARNRQTSPRQTYLTLVKRGMCHTFMCIACTMTLAYMMFTLSTGCYYIMMCYIFRRPGEEFGCPALDPLPA